MVPTAGATPTTTAMAATTADGTTATGTAIGTDGTTMLGMATTTIRVTTTLDLPSEEAIWGTTLQLSDVTTRQVH